MATDLSLDEARATSHRRADFQGLRAVAVLAVVAYHFGVPGISGGFVGVDIFFVISGFFITRLLLRDIEQDGRVRFLRFWSHRAKRLLPNGLLVVISVLAVSAFLLPSYRLPTIAGDAFSAAAFFANFHFAQQTVDYFHLDAPPSPLLHYWSLAVEEQFYLVLPVLVALSAVLSGRNARATVLTLLLLVALASFIGATIVMERSQPEAFFLPQYRAWQLAIGGLVGGLFDQRTLLPSFVRRICSLLGSLSVLASIFLLNDALPYPGWLALAPSLGTAALILGLDAGGYASAPRRVLAMPAMVSIGDMSYSIYLWHWPVWVTLASLWPTASGAMALVAGLVATALLASIAYFFVERPAHRMSATTLGHPQMCAAAAAGVLIVVTASYGAKLLPGRSDPAIRAMIAKASADHGPNYHNGCHVHYEDIAQPDCRFGDLGGPRVVLFGDSHAAQWFAAIVKAGTEAGWEVNAWTKTGCPTPEVTIWYPAKRSVYEQCNVWRRQRLEQLVNDPPALVILTNSTRYYGWIYDQAGRHPATRSRAELLWQEGFRQTTRVLTDAGISVIELRDTPKMYPRFKDCLSQDAWSACHRPREEALAGMTSPTMKSPLFAQIDLTDALCGPHLCWVAIGEKILYRDTDHLTATSAASLSDKFLELLATDAAGNER
ncbi:acyltransferase [Nitratireductor mangrovi]|uniref:Acyltransferase n=1 Tax=Nitratireductor mangrovi TaxID=2599600 RepID=A0A5B8L4B6_9HYPH|nr:acyltransferase family protein [Nitratireductor mangrovi]QDZ02408.1 acyltransferase [Nitratireductor mangrovi]